MRIIISHRRHTDASVTVPFPTSKEERNLVRSVLRNADKGRLAGRNE